MYYYVQNACNLLPRNQSFWIWNVIIYFELEQIMKNELAKREKNLLWTKKSSDKNIIYFFLKREKEKSRKNRPFLIAYRLLVCLHGYMSHRITDRFLLLIAIAIVIVMTCTDILSPDCPYLKKDLPVLFLPITSLFSTNLPLTAPVLSALEHQSADEPGNQQVVMVGGGFSSLVLDVCLGSRHLFLQCTW